MDHGGLRTTLPDGTPVLLREVGPDDASALLAGFKRLSPESLVFRFLRVVKQLSAADIDRFTRPDHTEHEAIGALVGRDAPDAAGIAHFFRLPEARTRAELALTVIDSFQRRGVGTTLLGRLLRLAHEGGITHLDAVVHTENSGMLILLRRLGAQMVKDGETWTCQLPVHPDPVAYPPNSTADTVRRVWKAQPPVRGA
ncbi:GNAT family N-acetyltransferase [Palleronia abyssalis]|uniref:Acetyltransferase Pat n=1 Tax=Palleronia abyssalis TaxID=1501240 RepID=A0A2R8BXE3_9RHOB|nr:GNAT family N-acetyltransferase [Palleronia abyssalis]SPJ24831.1 Acetyltransferase Pat [Palleronia abyssalis]